MRRSPSDLLALGVAILTGVALLAFSARLDGAWFDRHVIQLNLWPAPAPIHVASVPMFAFFFGVLTVLLCARAIRWSRRMPPLQLASAAIRIALALVCALVVGEGYLRWREKTHPRTRMTHELFGVVHPRYGWIWKPFLNATERVAGRDIQFAFDRDGIRVRFPNDEPDPTAPSILFAGESIAAGQGLQYEETYASLLASRLGVQPVNLGVNGYGSDQAYLRLAEALPRFEKVIATVTTFLPVQIGRNLQDLKPRLVLSDDRTLKWIPPASGFFADLRLRRLLLNEVPYCSDRSIATSIALTRAVLRDTTAKTRARGAEAVFLLPSQGPRRTLEQHAEAWLVHSVLEPERLTYILVDLEGDLLLRGDPHPSPLGARLIATALEQTLRKNLVTH